MSDDGPERKLAELVQLRAVGLRRREQDLSDAHAELARANERIRQLEHELNREQRKFDEWEGEIKRRYLAGDRR